MDSLLSGRDTLGVMPTGAGKSICFQVPGLLLPGTLVALTTGRVQVWFEDEKSLTEKAKLITKYNLGGASFWRKGFEAPHFWQSFAPQELT